MPCPAAPLCPIECALPDLQAWTAHFLAAPMPVLADTAELLETYLAGANEDAVDAAPPAGRDHLDRLA